MSAYYNEIDPFAAEWLRQLIAAGHIAPGVVDERSIEDVKPSELLGYTQCHFFAGIGVWSAALRGAGWPDDRPVWTGSCPCQPFSQAGKGTGVADERHLWPAWFHLIKHGKGSSVPVFGEQVASDDGRTWLDIVQTDLEGEAYTFRAVDICSAGFGSPNIRNRFFFHADARRMGHAHLPGSQRLESAAILGARRWAEGRTAGQPSSAFAIWMGNANGNGTGRIGGPSGGQEAGEGGRRCGDDAHAPSADGGLANSGHLEHRGRDTVRSADGEHDSQARPGEGGGAERIGAIDDVAVRSASGGMGDTNGELGGQGSEERSGRDHRGVEEQGSGPGCTSIVDVGRPGPTNGFWGLADWLYGKDDKWRPVEPGTFPLASGTPARVGRLRGYGNGLNKEAAEGFITAVMLDELITPIV